LLQEGGWSADLELVSRIIEAIGEVPNSVYLPSDDSFLMLDALSRTQLQRRKVLDIGTGSGIVGIYCALRGAEVTVTDINGNALLQATRAADRLGVHVRAILSDLFDNVQGRFEIITFNPPYLPSDKVEDSTVDGGWMGKAVIDRFLRDAADHLEENGEIFLLVSSLNDPRRVMADHGGYEFLTVAKRTFFFEELHALRGSLRRNAR